MSGDFFGHSNQSLPDRAFRALTAGLAFAIAIIFLLGGIAFALVPNPKIGNIGSAIAADIFLTLGLTMMIGLLTAFFPKWEVLQFLADRMFRKLMILAAILFAVLFIVLIVI